MGLASFLRVFISLSALSHIPSVLTLAFMMMLIPGATLLGANSVLLYGLAFVPIYFARKYNHCRSILYPAGVAAIVMLALAPGRVSEQAIRTYASRAASTDFEMQSRTKPQSIQLFSEYAPSKEAGTCNDLCQRLLFRAGISEVIVNSGRAGLPFRKFRLERGTQCPVTEAKLNDDAYLTRIRGGECLVAEMSDLADADVSIRETKAWLKSPLAKANNCSVRSRASLSVVIGTIRRIDVEERHDGKMQHVEKRTGLTGYVMPTPFYVGAVKCQGRNGVATQLASEPKVILDANLPEVLARRYGLDLDGTVQTSARSTARASVSVVSASQSR